MPPAVFALGLALLGLAGCGPERTLYVGGPVITLDAQERTAGALGVEGDRIAFVGSDAEGRRWADGRARVVDLGGRALLPGFIDAHGHFPGAGIYAVHVDLNSPPIGDIERMDGLVARLRERAAETPTGEWITGWGYDDTLLAEKRHPRRADLDAASTDHPIALFHVSGHLMTTNSAALELLGIDRETPDPEGGVIRRDVSGNPDGVFEEKATELVAGDLAQPGLLDAVAMAREADRLYLASGTTTAQNGWAPVEHLTGLSWLSRLGLVDVRMVLWPGDLVALETLDGEFELPAGNPPWVRMGAAKFVADGSIQGYTGYLTRPYHVPPGDDPEYRGYPRIPRETLIENVSRLHAAGWQVAVHGNGDASIDDILDAFEEAQKRHPREDTRHIVIHAQMARDDQLDRMRELGVIPSFFLLHTYYWGDRHRDIFMGPERAARMSPARSAVDRDIRFTIHNDTPVVPMEPLRSVWAAVNRRSSSGAPIGPEQRISVLQALRAVTIDAAYQHFEDHEKGSLEVGKLADLVILSRSPLDDPEHIDEIGVVETIIGGETVWRASSMPSASGSGSMPRD
ncbi:MAG TPA: amidohydrolase family protein [Myxococcota bacterium]|nr:amidohydrolase family protein [Myxococcota bacterium]MDP7300150.1 amidohydrolase family protein [Myxococcota bacterium]HJO22646.1 amidohydrolase family protein [Myxococcota bacterium]